MTKDRMHVGDCQLSLKASKLLEAIVRTVSAYKGGFVLILVAAVLAFFGEWAKASGGESAVNGRQRVTDASKGSMTVVVTEQAQKLAGIETADLKATTHHETVRGYGSVLGLENLSRLRENYAKTRADVETTRARLRYAREEYDRLRLLYSKGGDTSKKDVQEAEAGWQAGKAAFEAAQAALQAQEASIRQQWGAVLADWLQHASPSFERLMQQEILLVRITVSPQKPISIAPATAVIETPGGRSVAASFVSPAPETDPRIQGLAFFYTTDSSVGLLPGMNVSAYLPVVGKSEGVILPASAVVWWQGMPWVYIQTGPDRFTRRLVHSYLPVPGGLFMHQSFAPGERVAVAGAQLLLSREFQSLIRGGD
ncbi:MAG: hypothetical protein P8012_05055 [Desulfobacterales bacterium]